MLPVLIFKDKIDKNQRTLVETETIYKWKFIK